ncbi:MAG: hypothetical protein H6553_13920 [Chitinophagales bacterium]|nr:hypothetical protein [Chitinophagales bacterium]
MPSKRTIDSNCGVYFITFTNINWMPLFEITNTYNLIYNWFNILKKLGNYILGYVIMPNHVHIIVAFVKSDKSINKIIGDGKRFMAYGIIKELNQKNRIDILNQLESFLSNNERKYNKQHKVFENSFYWIECHSRKFIEQKLDYMHNNPCVSKWNLATTIVDYKHSSARFYITNYANKYVTHYLELEDIDLSL